MLIARKTNETRKMKLKQSKVEFEISSNREQLFHCGERYQIQKASKEWKLKNLMQNRRENQRNKTSTV